MFTGTPPWKPFDCKSRPNSHDVLDGDRRAHRTGGEPRLSHVPIRVGISDISYMSRLVSLTIPVLSFNDFGFAGA